RRRAPTCAGAWRRRPISPARWHGSCSRAAARATSPPSATASSPPAGSRAGRGNARTSPPGPPGPRARPGKSLPPPPPRAEPSAALAGELPTLKRDGGFVRAGYAAALDEARALRDESRRVIAALQARYADITSVRALKIRHNNVLGYFVEVTAQHGERLM